MKRLNTSVFQGSLILIFLLIIACSKEMHLKPGDVAPGFTLLDVDSSRYVLAHYEGRQVLIHFWADWCPHCREEFSKLENTYKQLKTTGIQIIAINVGQSKQHVKDIRSEYHLTFPLLLDEDASISKKYGVRGLPANYFINTEGKIVKIVQGWMDEEQIHEIIVTNKNNNKDRS